MVAGSRPPLDPEHHGLRRGGNRGCRQEIVGELHQLAETWAGADVEHPPEHLEEGARPLDHRRRAGRHDRKRAVDSAAHAAGDRRIERHDPALGQGLGDLRGHRLPGGGEVDVDPNRAAVGQAVPPRRHLGHHLRRRQADQHHLGARGHLGRRASGLGTLGSQGVHRLRTHVMHDQPITGGP
jgi:hypothetical protein